LLDPLKRQEIKTFRYIKKKDVEVAEDFKRKGVDYIRPERNDTETMKNSTRYQPLHLESPHHASQFKYDRDVDLREVAEEMETNSDILQMEREYIEHEKRLGFNITSRSVSESSEQIDMNDEEERLRFLRKPPEEIIGAGKNDEESTSKFCQGIFNVSIVSLILIFTQKKANCMTSFNNVYARTQRLYLDSESMIMQREA